MFKTIPNKLLKLILSIGDQLVLVEAYCIASTKFNSCNISFE